MSNILRKKYPTLKTRGEVYQEILNTPKLRDTFYSWSKDEYREQFLDICTGARGVKMLYDHFFKALFNPDTKPHRLEEFLSLLLQDEVKILKVLPNEGARVADENNMIIMDIVIEMADGRIANVECQKCGYSFPGKRAACYSADLLLRQYKRVKEKHKSLAFSELKTVYTIIFIEKSTSEFSKHPNNQIHSFKQTSNTGLELDLLQEYFFIPLDISNQIYKNKIVTDCNAKLEAWLIFLANDDPEIIAELIAKYPEFEDLYKEVYELCRNTEQVMDMFSEELSILEKNTVALMLEEAQEELREKQEELREKQEELSETQEELRETQTELKGAQDELKEIQERISEVNTTLADKDAALADKDAALADKDAALADKDEEIARLKALLAKSQN